MKFAYTKIGWEDHIVERPGTFKEIDNGDGTVTHVPQEGDILQQGTPVNAEKLNHMDEGIYQLHLLAQSNADRITALEVEVAVLKNASLNNFTHNMFIENLDTLNDVKIENGIFDEVNKRLVI